ncbi:MAG: 3,5-nucleoside bisphosphate phosphatase [Thermoanaerobacteraceae bacterium]|nr:3,5-nucleoside bisphosphate phosphatase [Thermoanaerobacteraceae bacterium]
MKRYECDLHCHTVRSDGNDTPAELIDNAAKAGMRVIAITDHDIQPPVYIEVDGKQIESVVYARGKDIELVLGYEFSCDTYVDDVHILGYGLDWDNINLKEEVERAKKSKSEAYRELCYILTKKGMPVDYENEILKYIDENGEIKFRDPDEVQRKHIFEMMAKKGYASTWKDAKILVRDDPELNIRRKKINPFDAIDLIKMCGGTAVLAHPFLIDEVISYPDGSNLTRREYIERLINHGLSGIEASYTYSKTSYKGKYTNAQIEEFIKTEYKDRVKFFTGGSDYHADAKKGVANPRYIGEAGISFEEYEKIREFLA